MRQRPKAPRGIDADPDGDDIGLLRAIFGLTNAAAGVALALRPGIPTTPPPRASLVGKLNDIRYRRDCQRPGHFRNRPPLRKSLCAIGRRLQALLLPKANGSGYLRPASGIGECYQDTITWEDIMGISKRLWTVDRRTILKSGAAIAAAQFTSPFIVKSLADEPVKIGMVNPLTGVLSALAQSEVDGAKYAEAEINKKGGILGRQVQLLVEDSANDVGTGVQKTRKLIDRDQVAVILGDVNSGIAYAMSQVTNEKKIFHIVPGGHTDPITGSNCKWNVFRVCNTTSMDANAVTRTGEEVRQEMVLHHARLCVRS